MKAKGNAALLAGQFGEAVNFYTEAIALDPQNHVLYSNRSAAHAKAEEWTEALADAEKTVEINPKWARGYSRVGAAHHGLAQYDEAVEAYKKGLELEPGSATFTNAIAEVEKARSQDRAGAAQLFAQFASFFSEATLSKMSSLPQVAPFANDPEFLSAVAAIRADPSSLIAHFQNKNVMTYVSICSQMGMTGGGGFGGAPFGGNNSSSSSSSSYKPKTAADMYEEQQKREHEEYERKKKAEADRKAAEEAAKPPTPELTDEQKQVLALKNEGNAAYTARKFDEALEFYQKALEIEPKNVNLLVNCTAVYFEKGEYEKTLEECAKAIEIGREVFADYKLIARAMTRSGNALVKLGRPKEAIDWYNKSLTEHRDAATLKSLRDLEKKIEDEERKAYINPELAAKAKEEGNEHFKAQRYPDAIASYSEAIKRDPSNATYLTNRATTYSKLGEYPSVVKDCDAAIALDPKAVKAYLRKGQAYHVMSEYTKAMEAFEKGLELDSENAELIQAYQKTMMTLHGPASEPTGTPEEIMAKAMNVPEVREILEDYAMQEILKQMTTDPAAAAEHLRNPEIRRRINILKAHGVIRTA